MERSVQIQQHCCFVIDGGHYITEDTYQSIILEYLENRLWNGETFNQHSTA